jgi:hypothetical protein
MHGPMNVKNCINYFEFGIIIVVLTLLSVSLVCWQEELQNVTLWVAIDLNRVSALRLLALLTPLIGCSFKVFQ